MQLKLRLWFGFIAALVFAVGVYGLALMLPHYSQVHQTVSEIGEMGSPARVPFAILLVVVSICILIFASAVREACIQAGRTPWTAYLTGFMAVSATGVGIFAYPHPLHNVFGLSETIAYLAPLVFALSWRCVPQATALVVFSLVMFVFICIAIALNLSALDPQGIVWAYVGPDIGLAQRALFAGWFGWCAVLGILLSRRKSTDSGR